MAEALAADIKKDILTCSICLGEYEDPRVLSCYHTFCYGCISDHAERKVTSNRKFPCPLCRQEIQIPDGGLTQLMKNFLVGKTKDIITQQQARQTLKEEQANVAAATQAIAQLTLSCEKHPKNELQFYCEEDDTAICGECIATEHSGHRISSVDKIIKMNRENIQTGLAKTMKTTNMFKDAVAKETAGVTDDLLSQTKIITEIESQAEQLVKRINCRKERLISEVNSAYDVRKKKKEANNDILEFHHTSLQSACDFAQQLVTNGTVPDIMVHAKPLIKRLAEMEKTPLPTPDTPAQISYTPGKSSTTQLEDMLGQVNVRSQSPLDVRGRNPIPVAYSSRLKEHLEPEPMQRTYHILPHYSPGLEVMLGKVKVQSQSLLAKRGAYPRSAPHSPVFVDNANCVHFFNATLKSDRKINISGLAIDKELVFVVDNKNNSTKMFTHAGEFRTDIKLDNPRDVAVSQTGQLYITSKESQCVEIYSTRGQKVMTIGHRQLSCIWGITMDKMCNVMVCDSMKKSILEFHADSGQLQNTVRLKEFKRPRYITVNSVNKNIVISDLDRHCVHVLSPFCTLLYQYGTHGSGRGELSSPGGVCTDSYGHIFIADTGNHRIVALSPQGEFIRYIATEDDGLECPTALAINPAGQLVVAERQGKVKTFQYLR
ncbi:tripartite motif-containing protein 3-like [Lingula anatina]|uniref:Tripartite motif-containing protein 3-like n=1 Tax=Lingula anatina TaxID=7574 RepID=A0A1S3ISB2_LINAN|nr:tripartite motif-containing protein 3-like [Lingula anatina]|eukprot:XP_013400424.1 tripartite motif-containing protein 3-like [Lingula anatina]